MNMCANLFDTGQNLEDDLANETQTNKQSRNILTKNYYCKVC